MRRRFASLVRSMRRGGRTWASAGLQAVYGVRRALLARFAQRDKARWQRVLLQIPGWDGSNRLIPELIPPYCSVLDLGSRAHTLRGYLKLGCRDQSCQIVKSSNDVLLCDLAGVYRTVQKVHDYAVCIGGARWRGGASDTGRTQAGAGGGPPRHG
jgi:hypothetical protein